MPGKGVPPAQRLMVGPPGDIAPAPAQGPVGPPAAPVEGGPPVLPRRQVAILAVLFGLSFVAGTITLAVAPVAGFALTGRADLATLPLALSLVGAMAATLPASRLMARWGRRVGFQLFTATAAAGALLASIGLVTASFPVFCAGSLVLGVLTGVGPLYRFAAVEMAPAAARGRAVAWVLAGGVLAGVAGPPLGVAAASVVPGAPFVGSYLLNATTCVLILLALPFVRFTAPPGRAAGTGRPVRVVARDRRFRAAVLAAFAAYAAMAVTMVAAPISLTAGGHPLAATGLVIQAHVVAMFAPSFFTGRLVERFGMGRMMAAGLATMAGGAAVNLLGHSVPHHWVALVLVGLGWNLLFVAATALLTTTHTDAERGSVQGVNDLIVAGTLAASAFAAGPLFGALGWGGLNFAVVVGLLLAGLLLAALLRRAPGATPPPATAG